MKTVKKITKKRLLSGQIIGTVGTCWDKICPSNYWDGRIIIGPNLLGAQHRYINCIKQSAISKFSNRHR
jgi:hypothetical protein